MGAYTGILQQTTEAMFAKGKGILAIDESTATIGKRFASLNIESTESTRRAYRDLLITVPGGNDYISGMILYDETFRQSTSEGVPFPKALADQGILTGIKVDTGAKDLAGHAGEKVTEGLDGLRERLGEYRRLGAKFAKWRAVITIGEGIPSKACIEANVHALARYAALCQEAGIVPIIEPEVLMDGDNTIEQCYEVTEQTLKTVFHALSSQGVVLEHTVLKINMVIAGKKCPVQASVEQVAEQTIHCLRSVAPAELPGIVFLSGGQRAELATAHLNTMNATYTNLPWPLSFSYGRGLQEPCLITWRGKEENRALAQKSLLLREKCNSLACLGQYNNSLERVAA